MHKFYSWLLVGFFLFSQNSHGAENYVNIPIGDINECRVRRAQIQDHMVWEIHDPKFDKSNEFNSLTAVVHQKQDNYIITSMTFPETNTSKIRAVNAFLNALIMDKLLSSTFCAWLNDDAGTPYSETLLGELLRTRFNFEVIDNFQVENFTQQTLGQGGFLKGTTTGISSKIIR